MALQITVDVFSGRPNPVLHIPTAAAMNLLSRAAPLRAEPAPPALTSFPRLGYRGLVIQHDEPALAEILPAYTRLYRGVLHSESVALAAPWRVEEVLLAPGGLGEEAGLPADLRQFIAAQVARADAEPPAAMLMARASMSAVHLAAEPAAFPGSGRAPIFEPAWWNDNAIKQARNNCYNYSTNYRTDTFAQPGRSSGFSITAISCNQIFPLAVADSLIPDLGNNNEFPAQGHLVALVMAPRFDFHWYRKGPDGMWSHKVGPQPVTNLDNSGVAIADPRTADRGPYTDFCGFMMVMHGHIKLE
jgi:hypothetical protein